MKKIKLFAGFLAAFIGAGVLCAMPVPATSRHVAGTYEDGYGCGGLQPLTEEDLEWMEENMVHTAGARLNSLGIKRVNEEREAQGLEKLDESTAAEFGEETIPAGDTKRLKSARQQLQEGVLKSAVDNMDGEETKKYFPPVVRQIGGSCIAYALAYYTMTYMNAIANDYNVKEDPSKILSPRFTYNLGNGGIDDGMRMTVGHDIALKHGCPSIADFPLSGSNQHTAWPIDGKVWRNALDNKMKEAGYEYIGSQYMEVPVKSNKDSNLESIKTHLSNGYVLNISTWLKSCQWGYRHGTDEAVCVAVDGEEGPHAMTVVGYDDDIWVDINGNGKKDTGELGAFKIVNSHGSAWKGKGWAWFAYDALNKVSAVSDAPSYGSRINGWEFNRFFWIKAYKSYTPILTAEFTVNTNKRNQVSIVLGQSGQSSSVPTSTWTPYAFNNTGRAFSVDGTTTASSATVVLDYTDLIKKIDLSKAGTAKWYLQYKGQDATFSGIRIKDETTNTPYVLEGTYASGGYTYKYKALSLPSIVDAGKQWRLKFNWPLDPATVASRNIFVRDTKNNNEKISMELNPDGKTVVVNPPQDGYVPNRRYTLNITKGVKTKGGNSLAGAELFEFIAK